MVMSYENPFLLSESRQRHFQSLAAQWRCRGALNRPRIFSQHVFVPWRHSGSSSVSLPPSAVQDSPHVFPTVAEVVAFLLRPRRCCRDFSILRLCCPRGNYNLPVFNEGIPVFFFSSTLPTSFFPLPRLPLSRRASVPSSRLVILPTFPQLSSDSSPR